MIVCICANQTDTQVRDALKIMTLDEYKEKTGACKNCCKCKDLLTLIEKEVRST